MDPTVAKGTIFTTKGAQNHLISDMWKGTVRKEHQIERQWKERYAKDKLAEEEACVREMSAAQKDARQELRSERSYLPRAELLKIQREQRWQAGRPVTSAQAVGAGVDRNRNRVLCAERASSPASYGHRPVVVSSFFRTSGVF